MTLHIWLSASARAEPGVLTAILDQAPATLNPRYALDAAGQKVGALLFSALFKLDADLRVQPDWAEMGKSLAGGKNYVLKLRKGLRDHGGRPVTPSDWVACLENYRGARAGTPVSALAGSFPTWVGTDLDRQGQIVLRLSAPDPTLPRNLTLLRYFRIQQRPEAAPCSDPEPGEAIVTSGTHALVPWVSKPERELLLVSRDPERRSLRLLISGDENTRALLLLKGEADAALSVLGLSKTRWFAREHAEQFSVLERDGVNVSYLAFNLSDPLLGDVRVRRALALAIPREDFVRHRMFGLGRVAGSLLSPWLSDAKSTAFAFDPERARKLLDEAGHPPDKKGVRLRLRYKVTSSKEGTETALILKDAFSAIGVELTLEVVEPAVFLALVRKGAFQLYSSRWIGVADGSILHRTLRTGQKDNRARYSSAEMDAVLDQAHAELDPAKRRDLWGKAQDLMARDLPYYPLWFWSNSVVYKRGLQAPLGHSLSLSGALDVLTRFR